MMMVDVIVHKLLFSHLFESRDFAFVGNKSVEVSFVNTEGGDEEVLGTLICATSDVLTFVNWTSKKCWTLYRLRTCILFMAKSEN
jgi:hypothetical protein